MGDIDGMSRGYATTSLLPECEVKLGEIPEVMELFRLCDPCQQQQTLNYHEAFARVHTLLQKILLAP